MNPNTHPEPEERERMTGHVPPSASESLPPSAIRAALQAAVEADGMTNRTLATALGYSPSVVSQYLNGGKYPGDITKLEKRVSDWLRNRDRQRKVGVSLIETDVSNTVRTALETIRQTNDVGVIYGDAGLGKTSGIILYLGQNPLALHITLNRWTRASEAIERAVFDEIENGGYKKNTSRGKFIADKLRGSSRLLIVDNAHKATVAGLEWLFDLHDETGIPIALVGNEEVLRGIESNDQRFSRVGLKQPVTGGRGKKLVAHLTAQIAPALVGQVESLIEQVADQHGRFRGAAKQLSLAAKLHEAGSLSPEDSVKAAHRRLVRNYALA